MVSWCGHLLPEAAAEGGGVAPPAAAGETPLLVVCGDEMPGADAKSLFEEVVRRLGGSPGGSPGARPAGGPGGGSADGGELVQLRVLTGRGQGMVGSAAEARILMEFISRHLALSTGLERDPSVVRIS